MRLRDARWILALALGMCLRPAAASDQPYEFGVFPYLPLTRIHELHAPMAVHFEKKLGRPVRLSSKGTYSAFAQDLAQQSYDVALIQPFDYVEAHDRHGYLPVARRLGGMQGVIVVREDSPYATLGDLKGGIIASPPPDAAVTKLTNMALRDAGLDPKTGVKRQYEKNHFTCLQALVVGVADACSTAEQPLRTLQNERRFAIALRVLHRTERIPHSLFVVHRRVSREHREILLTTIVNWPKTDEGRHILERGHFTPFVPARDADYEVVRRYLRGPK